METYKDAYIALNIIKNNNEIINKVPILFYWNGIDDIKEALKTNKLIDKIINDTTFDDDFYIHSKVVYAGYAKGDDNSNNYIDDSISFQELYPLEEINDKLFYILFIRKYFEALYKSVFTEIYDVALTFDEGDIINIYEKIQNKYPKRVNKETITNYIRSELTKDNQLSTQNIDFCINKLNILINE